MAPLLAQIVGEKGPGVLHQLTDVSRLTAGRSSHVENCFVLLWRKCHYRDERGCALDHVMPAQVLRGGADGNLRIVDLEPDLRPWPDGVHLHLPRVEGLHERGPPGFEGIGPSARQGSSEASAAPSFQSRAPLPIPSTPTMVNATVIPAREITGDTRNTRNRCVILIRTLNPNRMGNIDNPNLVINVKLIVVTGGICIRIVIDMSYGKLLPKRGTGYRAHWCGPSFQPKPVAS